MQGTLLLLLLLLLIMMTVRHVRRRVGSGAVPNGGQN